MLSAREHFSFGVRFRSRRIPWGEETAGVMEIKRIRIFRNGLRSALSGIHLVDRFLMVFMLILLLQSAYSLFFPSGPGTGVSDVDIIVRTSSAAIFGYFLSANFIRPPSISGLAQPPPALSAEVLQDGGTASPGAPRSRIGFSPSEQAAGLARGQAGVSSAGAPQPERSSCSRLQIIVAACVGLFCLVTLLLLRNTASWSHALPDSAPVTATVAQFRDFVSGCVGFLIGCPTHRPGQTP